MEVLAQLQHFKDALNASLQEEFDALLQKEANADELAEFSSKLDEPLKTEFNALLESFKETLNDEALRFEFEALVHLILDNVKGEDNE